MKILTARPIRVLLLMLAAAAAAASGYVLYRAELRLAAERNAASHVDDLARRVEFGLAELRSAQQAYVAAGQGNEFWTARVTELVTGVRNDVQALRGTVGASSASQLESVDAIIQDFEQMDRRARDYTRHGQQLMASDLIFTDGVEMLRTASGQVESVRREEMQTRGAARAGEHRQNATLAAALAAAAFVPLFLLLPVAHPDESTAIGLEQAGRREEVRSPRLDLARLQGTPAARVARGGPEDPRGADVPSALPGPAAQDAAPASTLRSMAELCTDFSRLAEATELPALLERAARLLDASGLIVWIADHPGGPLRAVLSHGYPAAAIARLKPISPQQDNATAAAYRQARIEVVRTNGTSNGALAAPVISTVGCVGVLSAEVRNGAECKASLQALASIIAAQLAGLVTPAPVADGVSVPAREASIRS